MADIPNLQRPPTPQILTHRLPDKPLETSSKPSKYIVLIMGSKNVVGKSQIAGSVAKALSSPFHIGDSTHDSSAKAAEFGGSEPNEGRYRRMWLSKMTRTGYLFPEESRPINEGFSGFGGGRSSTSTSRRGSASSIDSSSSNPWPRSASNRVPEAGSASQPPTRLETSTSQFGASSSAIHADIALPESELLKRANPVLMVLTHPKIEEWHKLAIRAAVGEYNIGVIFVPLDKRTEEEREEEEEEELPILRPLDPRTMTSFPASSPGGFTKMARGWGNLDEEMKLRIDTEADVAGVTDEIIEGVRDVIGID
ncbi:hypothetical protein BX600DRAFT_266347 [Xylariales sp. PMI_506]|nr:hypothetical protein BX600DRAFT_266347 [Xylariales sp. PMI_506]